MENMQSLISLVFIKRPSYTLVFTIKTSSRIITRF